MYALIYIKHENGTKIFTEAYCDNMERAEAYAINLSARHIGTPVYIGDGTTEMVYTMVPVVNAGDTVELWSGRQIRIGQLEYNHESGKPMVTGYDRRNNINVTAPMSSVRAVVPAMTKRELEVKLRAMRARHEKEEAALIRRYVMENNTVRVGDILQDHCKRIRVEHITALRSGQCYYTGPLLTKKNVPYKSGKTDAVWQGNIKEVNPK